jgi:hypothetical protein
MKKEYRIPLPVILGIILLAVGWYGFQFNDFRPFFLTTPILVIVIFWSSPQLRTKFKRAKNKRGQNYNTLSYLSVFAGMAWIGLTSQVFNLEIPIILIPAGSLFVLAGYFALRDIMTDTRSDR